MKNLIEGTQSVGRIAAEVPGVIPVFEKFGIDYYLHGNRSLREAAQIAGCELQELIELLRRQVTSRPGSWLDRAMVELTDHLKKDHHQFLQGLLQRVASELAFLGDRGTSAELAELRDRFRSLVDTLIPHFEEEERELFPLVDALETAWERHRNLKDPCVLERPMIRVVQQHKVIAGELSRLRQAAVSAVASRPAPRMIALLRTLDEIARNLHEYMHLENNVLFPWAVATRAELTRGEPSWEPVLAISR